MSRVSRARELAEEGGAEARSLSETALGSVVDEFMGMLSPDGPVKQSDHPHKLVVRGTTRDRVRELKSMSYEQFLLSEEWTETSRIMRELAHNRCEQCGEARRYLNVHHLTYVRRGEELCSDLVVVCHSCHMFLHVAQPTTKAKVTP